VSLRYSGPATLRTDAGQFDVHAVLSTVVASGTYSWGGRLTTTDVAAVAARGQGGTLTLSVPHQVDAQVHVAVADLHPDGGVLLRVDGHGRAPYERDGEITATRGEDGATVYQVAEETA
jgi:hypothetical protein